MNLPFFIAWRLMRSGNKTQSRIIVRIASAAVALSIAVMVATSALVSGFKTEINRKIFEFWGHLHLTDQSYLISYEPYPVRADLPFLEALDTLRSIAYALFDGKAPVRSRGGVRRVQAFAIKPGIIRTENAMEGILLKGIGTDFDWANLKPYIQEGMPIAFRDTQPSRDLLISQQTADRLEVSVGDKLVVHFVKNNAQTRRLFHVCGIYKTGLEEYDRKFALCDIRVVQELLGWSENEVAGFEVWLDDVRDMDLYAEYLHQEVVPSQILVQTVRTRFPAIFEWLQFQDYNEVIIFILMLAVALVNMITALLVLVLERAPMIGILKALGASSGRIRQIFLYHAAFITAHGLFWGNVVGLGFCYLQDRYRFITLNEADYYLSYAPVNIQWPVLLALNVGFLAVILLFLIIPSHAVGRISPIRVIHFR
ncbi:MAG: FtsX-like permease family protein [Saprospiraceae bacterium]|nr:FtsX-like permease family protein [Saprospiraceae bacterium]MDW8482712.1 FtsX-like permease family protein [Saprospiraceae bacterium]